MKINSVIEKLAFSISYVRFKAAQGDKVTFDYTWIVGADKGLVEVTLDKANVT